jgi:hypothetical protein
MSAPTIAAKTSSLRLWREDVRSCGVVFRCGLSCGRVRMWGQPNLERFSPNSLLVNGAIIFFLMSGIGKSFAPFQKKKSCSQFEG